MNPSPRKAFELPRTDAFTIPLTPSSSTKDKPKSRLCRSKSLFSFCLVRHCPAPNTTSINIKTNTDIKMRELEPKRTLKTNLPLNGVPGCGGKPSPRIDKAAIVGPMSDSFATIPRQVMRPVSQRMSFSHSTPSLQSSQPQAGTKGGDKETMGPDKSLSRAELKALLATAIAERDSLAVELVRAQDEIASIRKWYAMELRESNAVKYDYRRRALYLEDQERALLKRVAQLEREACRRKVEDER